LAEFPLKLQQATGNSNLNKKQWFDPLKQIDFKGASGMIKFLAVSCLSKLGILLKEP